MENLKIEVVHNKIIMAGILILIFGIFSSCDEDQFLSTRPKDFLTPKTAYVTLDEFQGALADLYASTRDGFFTSDDGFRFPALAWVGTEMVYRHKDFSIRPDWGGSILLPTNTPIVYNAMWQPAYSIIFDANTIVGEADAPQSQLSEQQKAQVKAVARFFRGYMYKMLTNLYGGVPIVLKRITSPRRDYTRASREEVYKQCVSDFKFAAENLPDINKAKDYKVNSLAAYSMLSEVYISLKKWQNATDAASFVIDNANTALMTQRFGTLKDRPGDVYWDLFRQDNQNRSSGNTEAIWVLQYQFNTPGGGGGGTNNQRMIIPRIWRSKIDNKDGSVASIIPFPNSRYYGRGSGFMSPTAYFYNTIWQKSGYNQDIRNSQYNIVRDFVIDNPASDYDGKWVIKDNVPIHLYTADDTTRNFYPAFAKASTVGQFPQALYKEDQTIPGSLNSNARRTYRDRYVIRLAEIYLLRAEAYLGKNEKVKAAEDINVVRRRAKAPTIEPSEVDLDYLLDERLRELHYESFRLLTLTRLGKLVERTRKFNPWDGDMYREYNNLWPIPFNEIEKNVNATIKQNPGY